MSDKKTVLLVEDDPMVIKMYERKLLMDGFDVLLAFNGEEGLEVLSRQIPDIILMDIMMPKMNGFEMLKRIKADRRYSDIPVIILTNLGDRTDDVEQSKQLGARDHLVKANTALNSLSIKINETLAEK
jgi:CheY-like chemotaxis protein